MSYSDAATAVVAQMLAIPEFGRLSALFPDAGLDEAMLGEVVGAAAALAEDVLAPFNRRADQKGCVLADGRVNLATDHAEAWAAFVAGGWTTIDGPVEYGGAGLPMLLHSACEEMFNRAGIAFGMLSTPIRCAARVIGKYASEPIKHEWLPRLVDGSWGATICISEADAGSDVPRLRTLARPNADDTWAVTGEKMWISFGDHPLTERIGHMVLARTPDAPAGSSGLSLFLVPNIIDGRSNGVFVRRIEEKLGLHGSPTCEMGFEQAQGWLIGTLNRGLSQLFTMIIGMRLSVGSQGAGIAGAAAELAWRYSLERRQGGGWEGLPVPINQHGDVKRQLLNLGARAEVVRGLVLTASLMADLQAHEPDLDAKAEAGDLLAWLLPITKNFCAEAAFSCASEAIQVLGGAGYTKEWPAEQYLRDARVLSIYEGTSGMQALDLAMRRVLGDEGRAMAAFVGKVRSDLACAGESYAGRQMVALLALLEEGARGLSKANALAVAYPFLQLASLATTGWIALRLTMLTGSPLHEHLAGLGRHWLRIALPMAHSEASQVAMGKDLVGEFSSINPEYFG